MNTLIDDLQCWWTYRRPGRRIRRFRIEVIPGVSYENGYPPPWLKRRSPADRAPSNEEEPRQTLAVSDEPALDYNSYPHIVDHITSFLPFRSLVVWRETCRRYRARFDITVVRINFHQLEEECMIQVRTGGGHLIKAITCRAPFLDFVTDHRTLRDPDLRTFFDCSALTAMYVTGSCSHRRPFGSRESTSPRFLPNLLYDGWEAPDFACIVRGETEIPMGHRSVYLTPDSGGALGYLCTAGPVTYFLDNWKANVYSCDYGRFPAPPPTDKVDRIWAFIVSGMEPNVSLFNTLVVYGDDLLYDFSRWKPPTQIENVGDSERNRITGLLEHARKHILRGQKVLLCGLERVDPLWLDPTYPGDEASTNTTPWPTFAAYIRRRIAESIPECNILYARIWVLPAAAASKVHYGLGEEDWGGWGTMKSAVW